MAGTFTVNGKTYLKDDVIRLDFGGLWDMFELSTSFMSGFSHLKEIGDIPSIITTIPKSSAFHFILEKQMAYEAVDQAFKQGYSNFYGIGIFTKDNSRPEYFFARTDFELSILLGTRRVPHSNLDDIPNISDKIVQEISPGSYTYNIFSKNDLIGFIIGGHPITEMSESVDKSEHLPGDITYSMQMDAVYPNCRLYVELNKQNDIENFGYRGIGFGTIFNNTYIRGIDILMGTGYDNNYL